MAFSYRNTLDSAISAIPQKYSDQILAEVGDQLDKKLKTVQKLFSYRTSPEVQEMLSDLGLDIAPICYQNHSHPACKMIENHLLYVVLPQMLKNHYALGVLSLREEKKKKFIKMRMALKYGEFRELKMFNSIIDGKDIYRYGEEAVVENFEGKLARISNEYRNGFNASTMFIHDELHYLSADQVISIFREIRPLKSIIATVVFPTEILRGDRRSKNPRIYSFDLSGDSLHFFPDSKPSEGYLQSVKTSSWCFKYHSLQGSGVKLRVSILQSYCAHHLISIERCDTAGVERVMFKKPPCLLDEELKILSSSLVGSQIERGTMSSILTYLSCLKSPNAESAIAKLRQLEKRNLFCDELNLIAEVSRTFSSIKCWEGLSLSFISKLKNLVAANCPWLSSFVNENRVWANLFKSFLTESSIGWFSIRRSRYDQDGLHLLKGLGLLIESMKLLDTSYSLSGGVSRTEIRYEVLEISSARAQSQQSSEILLLEYNVQIPTRDDGSREGVAICRADNFLDIEIKSKPDLGRRNSCVLRSIASSMGFETDKLISLILEQDCSEELIDSIDKDLPLNLTNISELSCLLGRNILCLFDGEFLSFGAGEPVYLLLKDSHCTVADPALFLHCGRAKEKVDLPSNGRVMFKIEPQKAVKLLKSLRRGTTGVLSGSGDQAFIKSVDLLLGVISDSMQELSVPIKYIWGAPGSGKTFGLINYLKSFDVPRAVVTSPRRLLADDWFEKLRGTLNNVYTHESFLKRDTCFNNCMVLDELSLYPPGFLDMALLKFIIDKLPRFVSGSKRMSKDWLAQKLPAVINSLECVVIGDPMQARYFSDSDELILGRKHDIDKVCESGANVTKWVTHRMAKWFEKVLQIECLGTGAAEKRPFHFFAGLSAVTGLKYDAILCASREDKRDLACGIPVFTFGEAQGLTFKRVLIGLTEKIHRAGDHHLFVGITRSIEQFDFIVTGERSLADHVRLSERRILGMILRGVQIPKSRLANLFTGCKPIFLEGSTFGSNIQEKASNDPFILPFCDLEDIIDKLASIDAPDESLERPFQKCHLPIEGQEPLLIQSFLRMRAKEERELYSMATGYSEQFQDTDRALFKTSVGYPFRYEAIFPKHSGSDSTTFWAGVKKRLRFSTKREELNNLRRVMDKGSDLASFFISQLPEQFVVLGEDIETGRNDFREKRMLKPASGWTQHSERSDIDWHLDWVFLFMKSQLCTKSEKMWSDAKAGQTLACFQHIVLFKFGPVLRAIELAFKRSLGKKFYIHSSKNFSDLNQFVEDNSEMFSRGVSVESDYEAFDSSQDHLVLAFELSLLKRIGVKQDFIDDYRDLKVGLKCRLGEFSIMRFTGEFCTFLFNTFSNMLFTFLKYEVRHDSRILFAGDDMASIGLLRERRRPNGVYKLIEEFRLKAKVEKRACPIFCGWVLTPEGIYKKPSLLWARLKVMEEKGLLRNCIDNYLLELQWSYRLGESLYTYLDEFEMSCHYKSVRFFLEHSSMCRGESLKVLKTFGATFGSIETSRGNSYKCLFEVLHSKYLECSRGFKEVNGKRQITFDVGKVFSEHSKMPSLGLELVPIEKFYRKGCRLYELMTLPSAQTSPKSRLMHSKLVRCIRTPFSSIEKSSTAFDALNPISKLLDQGSTTQPFLSSNFLMTMSLDGLVERLGSSTISISERYFSVSHLLFQTSQILKGRLSSLTKQSSVQGVTLPRTSSILKRGQHISSLGLLIAYQLLIRTFKMLFGLALSLRDYSAPLVERSSALMSGSCIDLPIRRDFLESQLERLNGFSKRSGELTSFVLAQGRIFGAQSLSYLSNQLKQVQRSDLEVFLRTEEFQGGDPTGLSVGKQMEDIKASQSFHPEEVAPPVRLEEVWGSLGHPRSSLINQDLKSSENMSVQEVVRAEIRTRVKRFIWMNVVDPGGDLIEALPVPPAELQGDQLLVYNRVLDHVLPYIFGNIAIQGTSSKIIWPDVEIQIPELLFTEGGTEYASRPTFNLHVVCPALDRFRRLSGYAPLVSATFRSLCEPFAVEAMNFLKERRTSGVSTNIYLKWPRSLDLAPWIAFDFASGLNMANLSNDERTVIDRMTKRLFRTEGQKMVFQAQGEMNLQLEG